MYPFNYVAPLPLPNFFAIYSCFKATPSGQASTPIGEWLLSRLGDGECDRLNTYNILLWFGLTRGLALGSIRHGPCWRVEIAGLVSLGTTKGAHGPRTVTRDSSRHSRPRMARPSSVLAYVIICEYLRYIIGQANDYLIIIYNRN